MGLRKGGKAKSVAQQMNYRRHPDLIIEKLVIRDTKRLKSRTTAKATTPTVENEQRGGASDHTGPFRNSSLQ